MALFDNDDAGRKEVRGLSQRFANNGVRWAANLDYVLLPDGREIEGVFPDAWIVDLHEEHQSWFSEPPSLDLDGRLVGFRVEDNSKARARGWLQARGQKDPSTLETLRRLLLTLDDGLRRQKDKLAGDS